MIKITEFEACSQEYSTDIYFNSIVSEFGLYCQNNNSKEIYQSIVFSIGAIISTLIHIFQDKFGRKQTILNGFIFNILGFFIFIFYTGPLVNVFCILCIWICDDVLYNSVTVLSSELLVNPLRNRSINIFKIVFAIGGIAGLFTTNFYNHYEDMIIIYFFLSSLTIFLIYLYLPESPSFMLKQKRFDEVNNIFERICNINKMNEEEKNDFFIIYKRFIAGKILIFFNKKK